MTTQGKKAAVLVDQLYQEMEVWYPLYRLREAGVEAILVGPEAGATYPSKLGYPAVSDRAAGDVSADDFDCLVIPGGYAPDHMRRHKAMVDLVAEACKKNKVVAAI
jgi:protease I